jgi:rhodanese-related sulfurtransferase
MKRTIILSLILLLNVSIYSCTSSHSRPGNLVTVQAGQVAKNVTAEEFKSLIEQGEGLLLDVRTPEEVAAGKIADASNIDYFSEDFKESLNKLDKNKPVYVYCRSGHRSGNTMEIMKELGFMTIYNLDGGIKGWQEKGLPVGK